MYILYLLIGIACLYLGAESLVEGSSSIALSFGVRKMVVALTIVALGTSMPEFIVSFFGVIKGADSVSVGNIVGSNIANLLLVLGVSALFSPITIEKRTLKLDFPFLMMIIGSFIFFCYDGVLSRVDGVILFLLFSSYMIYLFLNKESLDTDEIEEQDKRDASLLKNIFLSIMGIGGLIAGGNFTVKGGVRLAQRLGISELTIGLSVVALGTSLPEVFTSVVASIKKEHSISIGNVIGSNLFNTAFVLGLIPIISSLSVETRVVNFNNWFMAGAHILLLIVILLRKKIGRVTGFVFLLLYAFFLINLKLYMI